MDAVVQEYGQAAAILGALLSQRPTRQGCINAARSLCSCDIRTVWPCGDSDTLDTVEGLLSECADTPEEQLDRTYHHLFIGPNHLDPAPWGSVFLDAESVVFGDSCARLSRWMSAAGILATDIGASREPVDHIGTMLLLLGWLCENRPELVAEFAEEHLLTWAPEYFGKLKHATDCPLYQAVALLAETLLEALPRKATANSAEKQE